MASFLKELFNDNNTINEKSVVGFASFICMVIALAVDLITGWLGKPLVINEFIFDGFLVITLGSFGIASVDKWINNKNSKNDKLDSSNTCEKLHISMNEKLSNVCEPVKLFNVEYNVQGLNGEIMGQNIDYHPVGSNI